MSTVTIDSTQKKQKIADIAGNFCKNEFSFNYVAPTNSADDLLDPVGRLSLKMIPFTQVRVGSPLRWWVADPNDGRIVQWVTMCKNLQAAGVKSLILSDWDVPTDCCIVNNPADSTVQFWKVNIGFIFYAQNKGIRDLNLYGQHLIDFLNFCKAQGLNITVWSRNEPNGEWPTAVAPADYGALAKRVFAATGVKALAGDCNAPDPTPGYVDAMLADPAVVAACDSISSHSYWSDPPGIPGDFTGGPTAIYQQIAALGVKYGLPVKCYEWQGDIGQKINRASWGFAMILAEQEDRIVNFSDATALAYWEYQNGDSQSPASNDASQVQPFLRALQQMHAALPVGTQIVSSSSDTASIRAIAGMLPAGGQTLTLHNLANTQQSVIVKGLATGSYSGLQQTANGGSSPTLTVNGDATLALPAQSITTFLSGIATSPASDKQLRSVRLNYADGTFDEITAATATNLEVTVSSNDGGKTWNVNS